VGADGALLPHFQGAGSPPPEDLFCYLGLNSTYIILEEAGSMTSGNEESSSPRHKLKGRKVRSCLGSCPHASSTRSLPAQALPNPKGPIPRA